MATYRRGKVYWFEFWFQGRRIQESTGLTNKTEAKRVEAKRKADLLDRRAGFTQKKLAPRFEDQAKEFLDWSEKHHRPKTYELHKTNVATLLRFFKGKWLDEITRGLVENFKLARIGETRRREKGALPISAATVNRALTTLKRLYHHAKDCGFDVTDPTEGLKFFDEGSGRMRVVGFEEEIRYMIAASEPLKDIARVILDTGLRPEEVFRIRIENVDFGARTIFNPFGKTKAARRKVTMTADVCELLKRRIGQMMTPENTRGQLALFKQVRPKRKIASGPYVFASRGDATRPIGSVRKAHDAAVARAGIKDHFRLYDFRHTFATRAVASGVDLPTLSAILGHTKIQMTMRYVHPAEEQKRAAITKLETFAMNAMMEAAEKSRGVPAKVPTVN